jgi:two-component system, NtrC family, response regulator AtoC
MARTYTLVERLARSDLPVLVCGETGTGKELCAAALHHWSPRAARPLVTLNCAAVQETLVESELFGHERGAFTGAVGAKAGLLEHAAGGTLFLDEVGEMSPATQAKLLRVLETRRVTRVGDVREREVDIRVVAATNRDLEAQASAGGFRRDLYYRLSGGLITLPPLRERPREIELLARAFLDEGCARLRVPPKRLAPTTLERLRRHEWPGNVRELRNLMEYAAAAVVEEEIVPADLEARLRGAGAMAPRPGAAPPGAGTAAPRRADARFVDAPTEPGPSMEDQLRDIERGRMLAALEATGWNQTHAAQQIGMPLRTFQKKLKRYGLRRAP